MAALSLSEAMAASAAGSATRMASILQRELEELAEHTPSFVLLCQISNIPFYEQPLQFGVTDPIGGEVVRTPVFNIKPFPVPSSRSGQLYLTVIIKPKSEQSSPYDDRQYPLNLTFSRRYPDEPPRIRWACVMTHSQVDPLNFSDNYFYQVTNDSKGSGWRVNAGADRDAKMEAARDHSSLRAILFGLHGMLYKPLPQEIPPAMDDLDIYHTMMHRKGVCIRDHPEMIDEEEMKKAVESERKEFPKRAAALWYNVAFKAKQVIQSTRLYEPLHPELFDHVTGWREEWLDPGFLKVLRTEAKNQPSALAEFLTEDALRVYSFPLFTQTFCRALLEELKNYEQTKLLKSRPNSMNKFGLILNEMGMEPMLDVFVRNYLRPILAILYPQVGGHTVDHHHSFIVQYRPDADRNLDMHTDDSDVTLNACISTDFEGGGLDFCGMAGEVDQRKMKKAFIHHEGRGVLHLGKQRHGARDTTRGERNNIIIWCRSSTYRQSKEFVATVPKHRQEQTPDLLCLSRTHDQDYDFFVQYYQRKAAYAPSSSSTQDHSDPPAAAAPATSADGTTAASPAIAPSIPHR